GGKPLQGMYISSPDGTPLGCTYDEKGRMEGWTIERYRALLKKALNDFEPTKVAMVEPDKSYSRIAVKPPKADWSSTCTPRCSGAIRKPTTRRPRVQSLRAAFPDKPLFIAKLDLRDYFASIPHDVLLTMVRGLGLGDPEADAIRRFLELPYLINDKVTQAGRGV